MATEEHVENSGRSAAGPESGSDKWPGPHRLKDVLGELEHDLILAALQESHGNKAKAARALGITERIMGIRVKRLGIDWRALRAHRKHPVEHTV